MTTYFRVQARHLLAPILSISIFTSCSDRKAQQQLKAESAVLADDGVKASFELAAGTWDWARGDSTCIGNTHTITFASDHKSMILTANAPKDTSLKSRVTTYRVLSAGRGIYLDFPHVIRGLIDGESRRTLTGDQAAWDLVLVTPNRYHWHRTDWPDEGTTAAVVRCDGTRPMEIWAPPPPPPPQFGPTRGG